MLVLGGSGGVGSHLVQVEFSRLCEIQLRKKIAFWHNVDRGCGGLHLISQGVFYALAMSGADMAYCLGLKVVVCHTRLRRVSEGRVS